MNIRPSLVVLQQSLAVEGKGLSLVSNYACHLVTKLSLDFKFLK